MTGITNANIIPKDVHMSRSTTPRFASKPFVVCSLSTKRYAGFKTPAQRPSPTIRPTSSGDGPHVSNRARVRYAGRAGLSVVPAATKTEAPPQPSCVSQGRISRAPLSATPASKGRLKVIVKAATPRPRNSGIKPIDDITMSRTAARAICTRPSVNNPEHHPGVPFTQDKRPTLRNPAKLTIATTNEPFQRPGCIPRGHLPQASARATLVPKGKQDIIVKSEIPHSRISGIKASVDISATRTRAHATRGSSVNKPSVSESRPGAHSPQNERLASYTLIIYPDASWSPPPSPDLSSFPSQSWTIEKPSVPESRPEVHSPQNERLALYTPVVYPDVNWSPPPSPNMSSFPSQSWTIEKPSVPESRPGAHLPQSKRLALYTPVIYPDANWSPPPSPDLSSFPSQSWTIEKPSVPESRPGAHLPQNERLALYTPVIYPDVNWSPPPSPDLSSFPSQSWTIEKPSVPENRPGAHLPQNERLALYTPVIYPDVNWSPPPSPDLSSFPSQSWTTVACVDIKQAKTTTTVCSEEISPSTHKTEESDIPDIPDDFCGSSESESDLTSPAPSSSSTAVSTPPSSDTCTSGTDDTLAVGSSRKEPYVEVSPTECAAKIISRSKNGSTSADTLAKILERSQADSPTRNTNGGSTARTVRSVLEIARNLFSRSKRLSQVTPETVGIEITGTNVSRARKLLVPPLKEDTRPSPNPMIQMEIDVLRTRKKVAGGGVVNPRLERLGSLSAITIATKLDISSPDWV